MTHLCSDRVTHQKRRALIRKPQVGKALSSPPKAGRWVRFREQPRVISRECRRLALMGTTNTWFLSTTRGAGMRRLLLLKGRTLFSLDVCPHPLNKFFNCFRYQRQAEFPRY